MEAFRKIYPEEFHKKFLVHNVRPDGRSLLKIRKTTFSTGSVSTANGSAFVKMGHTSVVAGVKAEATPPPVSEEKSKDGQIVVSVELTPVCAPRFRKPTEQGRVLSSQLNRIINGAVSAEELDIPLEGTEDDDLLREHPRIKCVWYLHVSVYCLNYDGNIMDASLLAILAALKTVRLPVVEYGEQGGLPKEVVPKKTHELKLLHYPASLTFAMLDDHIVADPTSEEEDLTDSVFTIVYSGKGDLLNMWKPGGAALPEDKLRDCMHAAKGRASQVVEMLQAST